LGISEKEIVMRKGNKYLFQYRFINVEDVEVTGVVLAKSFAKASGKVLKRFSGESFESVTIAKLYFDNGVAEIYFED
jgi:hypothetical protein